MPKINNPILRVAPTTGDHQARNRGGGGGSKEFVNVIPELRENLSGKVIQAADYLHITINGQRLIHIVICGI